MHLRQALAADAAQSSKYSRNSIRDAPNKSCLDPDAYVLIEPRDSEKGLKSESRQAEITSNGGEHADPELSRLRNMVTHQRHGTEVQKKDRLHGLDSSTRVENGHGLLHQLGETIGRKDTEGGNHSANGHGRLHSFASDRLDAQAKGRFGPVRVGALVRAALDVASASPRRYFFEVSVWSSTLVLSKLIAHPSFQLVSSQLLCGRSLLHLVLNARLH